MAPFDVGENGNRALRGSGRPGTELWRWFHRTQGKRNPEQSGFGSKQPSTRGDSDGS